MKHLILALLAATFSLSVMAESINLNSSRSNVAERGKPSKEQVPAQAAGNDGIRGEREHALMGADSCNFAIDQKGSKFTIDEKEHPDLFAALKAYFEANPDMAGIRVRVEGRD